MSTQYTRRRSSRGAARALAVGVAVAALAGIVGAGQALAAVAPPDERVLERQRGIDRHTAVGQADEQGRVALPPQLSSEDTAAARAEQRSIRPEPPLTPDDERVTPAPTTAAPAGARGGLAIVVVVAALLAVGAATTWRVRHRRPHPEPTS